MFLWEVYSQILDVAAPDLETGSAYSSIFMGAGTDRSTFRTSNSKNSREATRSFFLPIAHLLRAADRPRNLVGFWQVFGIHSGLHLFLLRFYFVFVFFFVLFFSFRQFFQADQN